MHRIVNTNSNLTKWNIVQSPICTLCNDNKIDNIKHALLECIWTKEKIENILNTIDPDRLWTGLINQTSLLFGIEHKSIKHILLIIKHYIFRVRSGLYRYSVQNLKIELFLRILSEKKYSRHIEFESKWALHTALIDESVQYGLSYD